MILLLLKFISEMACFTVGFFLHYIPPSYYCSRFISEILLYSGILPSLYLPLFLKFISEILLYSGILPSLYLLLFLKFISEILLYSGILPLLYTSYYCSSLSQRSCFTLNNTLHQHFHSLFSNTYGPNKALVGVSKDNLPCTAGMSHTVAQKQAVKRSCLIVPFFFSS